MQIRRRYDSRDLARSSIAGFTLLETLVVVLIVGILVGILIPTWQGLVDRSRLKTSINRIYWAIQDAKTNARRYKSTWQASFRESDGKVQWAVHHKNTVPNSSDWRSLEQNIRIVDTSLHPDDPNYSTFYFRRSTKQYRVQFNYKGNTNGRMGRITLGSNSEDKRCVIVSTLIGTIRTAKNDDCAP